MQLQAHGRISHSFYGLLGTNEKALTFALAHAFTQSPELLAQTLKKAGIRFLSRRKLDLARITVEQAAHDRAFTDIEVTCPPEQPDIYVIFEAKLRNQVPKREQIKKYLKRLERSPANRKLLITLLTSDDEEQLESYGLDQVASLTWPIISGLCDKISASQDDDWEAVWLQELSKFIELDYAMKTFEEEVLVVPMSEGRVWPHGPTWSQLPFKEKVYFHERRHRKPLYVAFGVRGWVSHLFKIKECRRRPSVCGEKGLERTGAWEWARTPHWVYRLEEPVALPYPVPCGGRSIRASHVYCDLDALISSDTILEAERNSKARRGEA